MDRTRGRPSTYELVLLAIVLVVFVWSGVAPHDRFTWVLEVFPVILGVPALIYVYPRFRFTPLVYTLIAVHAIILMVGGKYTYAEVPLGFWMERTFGFARNHYDRIGHFAQGFVPAMIAREILLRRSPLRGTSWMPVVVICICLVLSEFYELFAGRDRATWPTRVEELRLVNAAGPFDAWLGKADRVAD